MSERGTHYVEADLEASWLVDWTGVGIAELEAYLRKVAAFEAFLAARDGSPQPTTAG
jgi:hypothetical protein